MHMNIIHKLKKIYSCIINKKNIVFKNLDMIIVTMFVYLIMIEFDTISAIITVLLKFNRLQAVICYRVIVIIGALVLFLCGIKLQKKYKRLKLFIFVGIFLIIYFIYQRYILYKNYNIASIDLLIYIFYPFINYISLAIGVFGGKVILKKT